jgi:hypothetical protein
MCAVLALSAERYQQSRRQRLSHAFCLESLLASWDAPNTEPCPSFCAAGRAERSGAAVLRSSCQIDRQRPATGPSRSRPRERYHGKAGSEANDPTNAAHHDRSPDIAQAQHTASVGLRTTAHALFARNGWIRMGSGSSDPQLKSWFEKYALGFCTRGCSTY